MLLFRQKEGGAGRHSNCLKHLHPKPMKHLAKSTILVLATGFTLTTALSGPVEVDPAVPAYKQTSGVSGNLNSIGSDTLNNLMTFWAEGFKKEYPNVNIQIEGKGSTTAPPALIAGTAQLGPMSREMKSSEIDEFEKKFGYKPTEVKVAVDALAVFVNKDNPIKGLTLTQVDGIFSSTRKRGGQDITTWGQVGLAGDWANKPMSLFGRNSASGTYGYFKEHALSKGDFKTTVKEQPGSSAVVQGVASDIGGIGYSGIGYITSGVRAVPLGEKEGQFVQASYENSVSGDYPLARFLYIYINKKPGEPPDKLTAEFLKFVLSKQGQEIVVKDGYFPIPNEVIKETLSAATAK
jgi:phosphate transport system substrate-binding protein